MSRAGALPARGAAASGLAQWVRADPCVQTEAGLLRLERPQLRATTERFRPRLPKPLGPRPADLEALVVAAFLPFWQDPRCGGRVCNLGGSRASSCSVVEAAGLREEIADRREALALRDRNRDRQLSPPRPAVARSTARAPESRAGSAGSGRLRPALRRVSRHGVPALFAFLFEPLTIEGTNSRAEHAFPRLLVTRKVCGGNGSRRGADSQRILASARRTARQRRLNPRAVLRSRVRARGPVVPVALQNGKRQTERVNQLRRFSIIEEDSLAHRPDKPVNV